jgi:hypothetical protein
MIKPKVVILSAITQAVIILNWECGGGSDTPFPNNNASDSLNPDQSGRLIFE